MKRDAEQILRQRNEWESARLLLSQKQASIKEKDSEYRMLSDQFTELNQKYNEANIQLIQQQNTVTALERELEIIRERLQAKEEEIQFTKKKIKESATLIDRLLHSIDEREKDWEKAIAIRTEKESQLDEIGRAHV